MYDQFYGFAERPFSLLPDPDFLFLGEKHRAALDTLELAIFNHSGFCVISGEIGAGKTTLIRELLNRLNEDVQVGLVSNTHPSFGELMQWVMAAYGLPGGTEDRLELHKRFIDFVIQRYADGRHTLLIIDEAQNLSMAALEELRMLSNVNSEKDLVLQIILVGQSELRDKLRKPELAQFAQRISMDYYLGGLTADETALYIQHRVTHAGGAADLFAAEACRRVYEYSQGIPRVINRLCDLSLVYGFAQNLEQINADVVEAVAQEQRLGEAMEAARKRVAEPAPVKKPLAAAKKIPANHESVTNTAIDKTDANQTVDAEHADKKEINAEPVAAQEDAPAPPKKPDLQPVSEPESEPESKPEAGEIHPELQVKPARGDKGSSRSTHRPKTNARPDDLHTLVVNAEKTAGARGERGALWLFLVVAVMAGVTAWMSRDTWLPTQEVAANGEQGTVEEVIRADTTTTPDAKAQASREKAQREEEARLAKQKAAEKANREKAARLAEQKAAEKAKLEQAEREKAKREKAANLAKQEAAEKAKLEQVKREKASREKAARLAKQKAAKKAKLEQAKRKKAKRDKAARIAKQRAAEKAKHEEAVLLAKQKELARREKADHFVNQKEQARRERAARAMLGSPDWSEEADEELVTTPVAETTTITPSEETTAVATTIAPPENTTAAATVASDEDSADVAQDSDGFSSNPCNGPTARFLSTCR